MRIRSWLDNPRHLFWVLQLGGWAFWGLIIKYGTTLTMVGDVAPDYWL